MPTPPKPPPVVSPHCCVIGIGSPHGVDEAGWLVVDELVNRIPQAWTLRKATVPHNVLDWISDVQVCHLVDASRKAGKQIDRFELRWQRESPSAEGELTFWREGVRYVDQTLNLLSNSSHQLELVSTLRLAGILGWLPRVVVLWIIPVAPPLDAAEQIEPGELSMAERKYTELIRQAVDAIAKEICRA